MLESDQSFCCFSQISAREPDPLGDQEVFLGPGRAAAPVSPPRVSLIVSKGLCCKPSRVNHTETQRLFVRAVLQNSLLQFLRFDVEPEEKKETPSISIFTCVPDFIDQRDKWSGLCICGSVCLQQLQLILIRVFSESLPETQSSPESGLS